MKFKSNVDIEAALAVSQNATFAGNVTIGDNSASEIFLAFNSSATDFALGANGSNFMIGTSSDLDSGNLITLSGTNGRLGIGTTSPSEKLDVVGNIELGDGGTGAALKYNSTNRGTILVNGSEIMRLEAAGNVGIGTTSPQKKLDVYLGTNNAVASIAGGISSGEYAGLHFGYSETGNSNYRHSAIVFERDDASHGDARGKIHILNSASGSSSADLGDSRLTILPSGNVGIGTTSPSTALEVIGDIKIKQASNYSNYSLIDASEALLTLSTYTVNASAYPADIKFSPNQTERMRITDDGNIGIGTTAPQSKLTIGAQAGTIATLADFRGASDNDFIQVARTADTPRGVKIFSSGRINASSTHTSEAAYLFNHTSSNTITTGDREFFQINGGWSPSSGTSTWAQTLLTPTINTTGTYAGTVRGIYYNPTVTSATGATHRAIETTAGDVIFNGGNVGIGTTSPADKLTIQGDSADFSIRKTDGTLSARLVQFGSGASELRLYDASASQKVSIHTVGTSYFNGGNVGIGTTSPAAPLHVVGNILVQSGRVYTDELQGYSTNQITLGDGASTLNLISRNSQNLAITGGNVGIGTTSPNSKLDIRRSGSGVALELHQTSGSANDFVDLKMIAGSTSAGTLGTILRHKRDGTGGGDFSILTNPSLAGTPTEKLIVKSSGNVGIGTSSPGEKLEIAGYAKASTGFKLGNYGLLYINDNNVNLKNSAYYHINFYTNNAQRMRITNAGNVGIGTTSPNAKLEVTGDIEDNWAGRFENTHTGGYGILAKIAGTSANERIFEARVGTSTKMLISGDGNATFAGDLSLADNKKLKIGTGGDIQIFHDTSSSFIDSYNQNLVIRSLTADKDILFQADDSSGGVATYFYLDGSGTRTIFEKLTRHNDNVRADFGTDSDLRIFHDSSNSYIQGSGTGDIIIQQRTDDKDIVFQSDDGSGGIATYFRVDGSEVETRFHKSTRHFDNVKAQFGDSADLQIYHDGSNSYIQDTSGTGDLIIDTSTFRLRSANGGETMIRAFEDSAVILSHNSFDKLATTSTGVTVTGAATATTFLGDLNGTINTVTTAVTKANATNDTTVATTAFVQNLIGTIPAGLVFQGTWNATTNTPTLTSGSGTTGHFYIVSTDGSTNLDGVTDWKVGDWAVFIEQGGTDAWEKIDNSSVLGGAGTGGKVPVWSGTGTSVTLADAPITVSGNHSSFTGDVLPLVNGGSNLGSNSKQWGSIYAGGIGASTVTLTTIKLNGSFSILNKAQNAYIGFATRNTSGSQTVMDLTNVGSATFAGKINAKGGANVSGFTAATINAYTATVSSNLYSALRIVDNTAASTYWDIGAVGGASPDLKFFVNAGTTPKFTLSAAGNATFAGNVTLNGDGKLLKFTPTSYDDVELGIDSNGFVIYNTTDSRYDLKISGTGNATFGGDVTVGDDVFLADGGVINLGTDNDLVLFHDGADAVIRNNTGHVFLDNFASDKDIYFRGKDGTTTITALHLDMSNGGSATFVDDIDLGGKITQTGTGNNTFGGNVTLSSTAPVLYLANTTSSTGKTWYFSSAPNGNAYITQDGVIDALRFNHTTGNAIFGGYVNTSLVYGTTDLNLGYAGGTSGIFIKGSTATAGNVGIGDTAPSHKLTVPSGTNGRVARFGNLEILTQAGTYTGSSIEVTGSNSFIKYNSTLGHKFFTRASGGGNTLEALTIVPDTGNVGIGASSPKSKLQVAGGIQMADDTAAASADKVGTMRYRTGTEYVEVNGTELVTNGNFATDSSWTKGTGWSIGSGVASLSGAQSAFSSLSQPIGTAANNKYYRVIFTITAISAGGIRPWLGAYNAGTVRTAVGTYTEIIQAASGSTNTNLLFEGDSLAVVSVDNVSVIEVVPEDASYADMCMQTGSSTYEWVNIVRNTY